MDIESLPMSVVETINIETNQWESGGYDLGFNRHCDVCVYYFSVVRT